MAKRKQPTTLGCLAVTLLALGLSIQLLRQNPWLGIVALVSVLVVAGVVLYLMRPRQCGICGNGIQRKSHVWMIAGVQKIVCVHCNQSLARKKSSAALRQFK